MSPVKPRSSGRRRVGRLVDLIGPAAFPTIYLTNHDFVAATWATTIGALLALGLRYMLDGSLAPLSIVSGILALGTGLLALAFGSEAIVEAKPTIIHLVVGIALIVAWLLDGRPAKALLAGAIELPDHAWATLCLRFGLFALLLCILNEVVLRAEPTSV